MIYEGTTPRNQRVLIDTDDCSMVIEILFCGNWITQVQGKFGNLRVLAEHLSDTVMYGYAVELLHGWGVKNSSPLWTLNHKAGYNHFTDR